MGNKSKRAKRAKSKAKSIRINRNKALRKESPVIDPPQLSPETIAFFNTLPSPYPENTAQIMYEIESFISVNSNANQINDLDATVDTLTVMYAVWYHEQRQTAY